MRQNRSPVILLIVSTVCLCAMTMIAIWRWPSARLEARAERGPLVPSAGPGGVDLTGPNIVERPSRETCEELDSASRFVPRPETQAVDLEQLGAFAVAPRYARPAPPVADRIRRDPSLAELPLLSNVEASLHSEIVRRDPRRQETRELPAVTSEESTLARHEAQRAPAIATCWPYPQQLLELLGALRDIPVEGDWVDRLEEALLQLHSLDTLSGAGVGSQLERLRQLADEGTILAAGFASTDQQAAVLRVVYALQRRLAIWQSVHELTEPRTAQVSLRDGEKSELPAKLTAVNAQLAQLRNADDWRQYLLLDQLSRFAAERRMTDPQARSVAAREFLRRWESAATTREEEAFFAHADWQALSEHLRDWVCEPVNYDALLEDLERLELAGSQSTAARDLAHHYQVLRWSSHPQVAALGDCLNTHYRNANVRVAISGTLLNRLLPHPQVMNEPVNDRLMGGRIFGRSRVSTRLQIVLLPDLHKWRLGLEAHGDVDSNTQTKRGPARFHSAGRSRYLVRKLLLVDRFGVHTRDAEAEASSRTGLTRIETDVDGVPLVNLLVRSIAKQMYDSQSDDATSAAEGLLANRAQTRLDQEVDQKLSDATQKFRRAVWLPLQDLGLSPEAVDMQTTEERLVARYRLASHEQVGAFTPRPQAPADSMVSIQIHESVLNNVVCVLDLGGRTMGLREMFQEVAQKLHRENFRVPEDVPDDVTIELARDNPIAFSCEDDRIHVTLRIVCLAAGDGHCWNDFEVCGMYIPHVDGLKVGLERDSYIRLRGNKRRLPLGDQVALRGIFARVLAPHPDIDLLASVLSDDQRLNDLQVSQFVIRDGWIGVAVGPGHAVRMRIADDPTQSVTR